MPTPDFAFAEVGRLENIALELVSDDRESFGCLPWLYQHYPEAVSYEAAKRAFAADRPRLMLDARRALVDRQRCGYLDAASWRQDKWGAARDIATSSRASDIVDHDAAGTAKIELCFDCDMFPGRFFHNVTEAFAGLTYSVRLAPRETRDAAPASSRSVALLAALSLTA